MNIPRGLIKHGILYYLGATASFILMVKTTAVLHIVLIAILLIISAYTAYLNFVVDRKGWAIVLGAITLFFVVCIQGSGSSQASWRPYFLIIGFIFIIFLIMTVVAIMKKLKK